VPEKYFAPCPRGLEAPLAAEIARLGAQDVAPADGGVGFAGDLTLALHANLESRLASRILWRVGGGGYRNERDLYDVVQAIDWPRHFDAKRTLRVDVAASTRRAAPRTGSTPPGGGRVLRRKERRRKPCGWPRTGKAFSTARRSVSRRSISWGCASCGTPRWRSAGAGSSHDMR